MSDRPPRMDHAPSAGASDGAAAPAAGVAHTSSSEGPGGDTDALHDIDAVLRAVAASPALADCDVVCAAVTDPPPLAEPAAAVARALAAPVAGPRLRELAKGRHSAAVITSDITRAVPNRLLLPPVLAELAGGGIPRERVRLVIGGGAHRPATRADLEALVGADLLDGLTVVTHDARRSECLTVGVTPAGNELLVNRAVAEAGLVVALGVVEPHEFAGFTGGRKAVLPAVAGYDSIMRNHSLAMLAHRAGRPGILDGNPFHDEMVAAAQLLPLEFIVNVTLDGALRPTAVAAGDAVAAHERLVEAVRATAAVPVPATADVIVTGPGEPLDVNLYQAVKALVAVEPLCGAGSTVVLLAGCREGNGSDEMLEPFVCGRSPRDVLERLQDEYALERDHTYFIARFRARGPRVLAVCPGVPDDQLRTAGFEPVADAREAAARALAGLHVGAGGAAGRPTVLLLPRPQRALFQTT